MVGVNISSDGHTDLCAIPEGLWRGKRYSDLTIQDFLRPNASVIGADFQPVDVKTRPHGAKGVDEYTKAQMHP